MYPSELYQFSKWLTNWKIYENMQSFAERAQDQSVCCGKNSGQKSCQEICFLSLDGSGDCLLCERYGFEESMKGVCDAMFAYADLAENNLVRIPRRDENLIQCFSPLQQGGSVWFGNLQGENN